MDDDTYQIIGAAFEVHSRLGSGFLEAVYQEALRHEFAERGIPFRHQVEVSVFYKGKKLQTSYRTDFICYEAIVVELKAISKLGDLELAQVFNYLRATGFYKALLFNFGAKSLEHRRLVISPEYLVGKYRNHTH
jgi:GxxExxY protein